MTSSPRHLNKKEKRLMNRQRSFSCKKRDYVTYDYLTKGKIAVISKAVSKNNNNQKKESLLLNLGNETHWFHQHSYQSTYFARVFTFFHVHLEIKSM